MSQLFTWGGQHTGVSDLASFLPKNRRRQWHPTPVLLPGRSHEWRSLEGCSPWGRWGSDTTERLHFHFSLSCIGEGNGNPLQCSCLENPGDGKPGGLPSLGLHRVRHDWSDLALPKNTQDWSPLEWTGWISLKSKGLSSLLQHHSSKAWILLSHPYMTTGKTIALTGRPGVLRFMGSQRVGHDWATELNWTELRLLSKIGFVLNLLRAMKWNSLKLNVN